jgi:hypothetical protein
MTDPFSGQDLSAALFSYGLGASARPSCRLWGLMQADARML